MVRPGRDRLSGRVEVDETYLGAQEEGVRGRQTDTKALIVGSHRGRWHRHRADSDAQDCGRLRGQPDGLRRRVDRPGSVVHTDGWLGYKPLERHGYRHQVSYLDGQPARASELLPRVHAGCCRY